MIQCNFWVYTPQILKIETQRDIYTFMFITALFTRAEG